MSLDAPPAARQGTGPQAGEVAPPPPGDTRDEPEEGVRSPLKPGMTVLAASLAAAAAAWMVSGIFRDPTAHVVALVGVLIGGGLAYVAYRWPRLSGLQYVAVAVAALVGAALVAPDAQGSATVPSLVEDALRGGGLLQPPISFDPGWRFVLVVVFAGLTAGGAGVAVTLHRPKLAAALPIPVTMGAALIQPAAGEIPNVAVALLLAALGLTLAYGVELGGDGGLDRAFEMRRVLRGGAFAAALGITVLALGELGFLFPQPDHQHVIPPQKPQTPPQQPDHVLFTYSASRLIPLHLGDIDTYDPSQQAWLLPPYDATRLRRLQPPARIPGVKKVAAGSLTVTFHVDDMNGHALPVIAAPETIHGTSNVIAYDPLTQSISLADRPVYAGLSYTVTGAPIPTGKELAAAPAPPRSMAHWLVVPNPPNQVVALLNRCNQQASQLGVLDQFNRLVCVRQGLLDKVVAAGPGTPVDVSAARVGQMLDGAEASPYEIAAAEALLARWAGVPSRIGYGYYGGTEIKSRGQPAYQVHPVDGSMWLEVWFQGYGWQPIVGVPPKAKPSTNQQQKQQQQILAADQIQLLVYLPTATPSATQLFVYVRYYLARVAPAVLLLALLLAGYPWLFKLARTRRRRRWGPVHGLEGRIAAAYAEFRDRARDLTIGDPAATPIDFLEYVADDAQHEELAWLVTRALWGDLRRDLRPEDAEAAEKLARSVTRRLDRAQPAVNRVLARIARTSLREPYSTQVPNFWVELEQALNVHALLGRNRRVRPRLRVARPAAAVTALVLLLTACGVAAHAAALPRRALDTRLVPGAAGGFELRAEKSAPRVFRTAGPDVLVTDGAVYTLHASGVTAGALEEAVFRSDVDIEDINNESLITECAAQPEECPGHEVVMGMQENLGSGRFHRIYYRHERAYVMSLPDQRIYVWFPPGKETMMLLDVITRFVPDATAEKVFDSLIDYQHEGHP